MLFEVIHAIRDWLNRYSASMMTKTPPSRISSVAWGGVPRVSQPSDNAKMPPSTRTGASFFRKSEQRGGIGVLQALFIGNSLEGQMAVVGVQALHQGGIPAAGLLRAQICNL